MSIKNTNGIAFYQALELKYKAEILECKAVLSVYFNNSTGIGEHSDLLLEFDKWIQKLADAEGKLESLIKNYQIVESV